MPILIFLFLTAVMAGSYYGLQTLELLRAQHMTFRTVWHWRSIRAQRKRVRLLLTGFWGSLFAILFFSLIILIKTY